MEQTQRVTVGEMKFRSMVNDLMVMEKPGTIIQAPNSSKARSLRRSFYNWTKNLAEMERTFMENMVYRVVGRTIFVEQKADWQPIETGVVHVPSSESKST